MIRHMPDERSIEFRLRLSVPASMRMIDFHFVALVCLRMILILSFVTPLISCNDNSYVESPPLRIPFDLSDPNSKLETTVQISEFRNYSLGFEFLIKNKNQMERAKVRELVAGSKGNDNSMRIAIQLNIIPLEPSTIETNFLKNYSMQRLMSWSDSSLNTEFDNVRLRPGTYRIVLANQRQVDSFRDVPMNFIFASNPKSTKIID